MSQENHLTLQFPDKIDETDFYTVKRTVSGKTDNIKILIWSAEDIAKITKAEEVDQHYENDELAAKENKGFISHLTF